MQAGNISKATTDVDINDDDYDGDDCNTTTARFVLSTDGHWFEITASTPEEVVRLTSFVRVVKSTMAGSSERKFKVPGLKKLFKSIRRETADNNNKPFGTNV